MAVRSTQANANASFKVTWKNGRSSSQVDHILTSSDSTLFLTHMRCTQPHIVTDHKLLLCDIGERKQPIAPKHMVPTQVLSKHKRKPQVDVSHLREENLRKRFEEELVKTSRPCPANNETIQNSWKRLCEKINKSVDTVLRAKTRLHVDRDCRLAQAHVKRCAFWAGYSYQPKWKYRLIEAKETLRRNLREYEERQITDFFKSLNSYPAGDRINKTYKFLKNYKKRKNFRGYVSNIRNSDWVDESNDACLIPKLLDEPSTESLPDPPSVSDVTRIVLGLKNGKTPGLDGLYAEYFKYADSQAILELHQMLCRVWTENIHPTEWKHTIVVPIPKIKNPKCVKDYRRICLSSVAYKIYAIWLLEKLQNIIGPLGVHQAAFLIGHSTIDHLHVVQRVLQENWNAGNPLIVMSLDIEKAFDRVSLTSLPAILRGII
ncbi:uncharacterized protein LOC129717197 [Wyeomyia smithii]|uniref:uncharacterized protein LOC129717197 n=1 Tax=Wyeomyia smithii TaxID=174621 RepID=UPI002467F31E|nr:uncharacterized protein LOC129717197 [Wyeomyia smithii]